ncbi:hypothetical protein ECZC06_54920 [Escherichia coli]|nr:hypothetical protein ECZC06_54920 [Escherichia coli]GJI02703.1 hypothetical protein ECZC11_50740 [Escherichia coli]GJI34989.1 hypothetical protein ECZC18_50110 [Escherichia coli]GJI40605.1 hypothetical protein ECZC19_50460 [Escherichia coli]
MNNLHVTCETKITASPPAGQCKKINVIFISCIKIKVIYVVFIELIKSKQLTHPHRLYSYKTSKTINIYRKQ